MHLKECPCVGTSLCSPRVPSSFGGRAGSEVNMGHTFHWGALGATALVRGRAEVGEGLEPEPGASWGFSYAQWHSLPYWGWGKGLRA